MQREITRDMFTVNFSKKDYKKVQKDIKSYLAGKNTNIDGGFYGNIYIGKLCFDVLVRDYGESGCALSVDCYAYGLDRHYATLNDGTPYAYCDGTDLYITKDNKSLIKDMPYRECLDKILGKITDFINDSSTPLYMIVNPLAFTEFNYIKWAC